MKIKLLFILSIISQIIFAQDNVNPSDLDPIEKVQLTTSETTSYFGNAISFSADGTVLAIGEYGYVNSDNENTGRIQVYENQSGNWNQKGQDIFGIDDLFNSFGKHLVLSQDGNTLAVYDSQISVQLQAGQTLEDLFGVQASQYFPYVQVYQYNNGNWAQIGNNFLFNDITEYSDMSLSGDGSTIAIATKNGTTVYELNSTTWNQIGQQIPAEYQIFNESIQLSENGETVIIGAPFYSDPNTPDNPSYEGVVKVLELSANSWIQKGNLLTGTNYLQYFGSHVDISSDGNTIAISSSQNNDDDYVQVYEFSANNWIQKGSNINQNSNDIINIALADNADTIAIGEIDGAYLVKFSDDWNQINQMVSSGANDDFGYSITIDENGDLFAVGAPSITTTNANGYVTVYGINENYIQLCGDEIYGNSYYDQLGNSVDTSHDGNIVAIGASGRYQSQAFSRVEVYEKTALGMQRIGDEILTPASNNSSFGAVVRLSADGNLLAISDPFLYNSNYGVVYTYQRVGNTWVEYADPIYGEYGSRTGTDIEFSTDGSILAVGSGGNPGGVSGDQYKGYTQVYQFDSTDSTWEQIGQRISGEAAWDFSGGNIGLSGDGTILAIGAIGNDGETGNGAHGHVRIFKYENDNWNQMGSDIDGDPAFHVNFGGLVELSNDGTTVMISDLSSQSGAGSVEIYNWDESSMQWVFEVRLKTYEGTGPNNSHRYEFGSDVKMSLAGNVLIVGEHKWKPSSNGAENWGRVNVYTKTDNEWIKNDIELYGRVGLQYFGSAIGLSANGNTVAIGGDNYGAYNNSDAVPDFAGMVGVYHLNLSSTIEDFEEYVPVPITIPDPNFEQALIDLGIDSDGTVNQQLLQSDAASVTSLDVSSQNISDLTGIEGFISLETLFAFNNNLSTVDLSANTALSALVISINHLTDLDVTNNTNLVSLSAGSNQITSIDLSNNSSLNQLIIDNNELSAIDVSSLSQLAQLNVSDNNLVELDLASNGMINQVLCENNDLVNLNMQNGNNSNVNSNFFNANGNSNLYCIQVDDVAFSNANWPNIDSQSFYGLDCAPSNDDCFEAQPLNLGDIIAGTTLSATSSASFPSCQEDTIVLIDVWYQFTAPSSGLITAIASSALNNINVNIALYENCNQVEPISCDSGTVEVSDLIPGETYYLQLWVGGNPGGRSNQNSIQAGDFTLELRDSTLSLEENTITDTLKVYPNPTNSIVNIEANVAIDSVVLFDITGKQVLVLEGTNKGKITLNLEDLSKGLYMIQIKNESTLINKKLLIK